METAEEKIVSDVPEQTEGTEDVVNQRAKTVLYCGVCGLPPEYCEFGPDFERCKPWLIENCPEVYPELIKKEGGAEDEAEAEDKKKQKRGGKGVVRADKPKKGGKEPELLISTSQKKGRKIVTTVSGLKAYGINPKDAASVFKKKFASGASVTKEGDVDIQGDLKREVLALIDENEEWKIPASAIRCIDNSKKRH